MTFWVTLQFIFFFGSLAVSVFIYRREAKKTDSFIKPSCFLTSDEFDQRIQRGSKLVIIDDLVVDVGEFMNDHPGGNYLLKHNIGKDVSKFFYGGYSLDGNVLGVNSVGHFHSNFARKLVNKLTIAKYESFDASEEICKLTVKERVTVVT